jgi:hypothetical protein
MQLTANYWLIRYPDQNGSVVGRFEEHGPRQVPDIIDSYDSFVVETVADRQTLVGTTIDQSGLSDDERTRLSRVFPSVN